MQLLVNVGSTLLVDKLIDKPELKSPIGSGTPPLTRAGPSLDIDLPEGSEFDSLLEDANLDEEQLKMLLQLLSSNDSVLGLSNGGDIGTITPYEPSPLENQQQAIAKFLVDKGIISDNYRAQRLAEDMTFLSEFIPGFGDVQGVREGKFMMDEGSPMMGGMVMAASMLPFIPGSALMRKAEKLQAEIKQARFDQQRELRNMGSGDGDAAFNASERFRKKADKKEKQLNDMIAKQKATPNLEPTTSPKTLPEAVQGELNLQPKQDLLFHGSQTTGLKNLELPTGQKQSRGGIYSLVDPKDPRFTRYVEGLPSKGSPGSGYVLQPRFEKELDINNIPEDMLQKLTNLEMYRGRPSRLGSEKLDFDINQVLRGEQFMRSKTPMNIDKDFADVFTKEGYDALRFPPRAMKDEGETVVALDPSKLDIVDEIPFDQLDDYIRTLLND